jgi:hypothetical protein
LYILIFEGKPKFLYNKKFPDVWLKDNETAGKEG